MPSGVFDDAMLKHIWGTEELRAIFSDRNRVQKWYDYEAALALEQAELGIVPRAVLTPEELRKLLDPTTYVGLAPQIVDQVLAQSRADGWLD